MTKDTEALYASLVSSLDLDTTIDDLANMIRIRSENPCDSSPREGYREKEIGEYLAIRLSELKFEVDSREIAPGRPNVWGRLKGAGGGPTLMLAGHLDTVGTEGYDDPFEPRVDHGRVYGRGSCDMKAALAAYLAVARLLINSDIKLTGDLIIAGIADEEWKLGGSRDMGENGPWADFGIIGEPTDLTICPAHKGQCAFVIRTFGKAVHSSVPEKGHNAIEDMGRIITVLSDYDQTLRQRAPDPNCGNGRFSMGVVRGGSFVCTVPDYCELEVDRRTIPGETEQVVRDEITNLLDKATDVDYEISEPLLQVPPLNIAKDSPVIDITVNAFQSITGKLATVQALTAATDAPNLGFPAIIFGPGTCEQAHSLCEYVEIEQIEIATKVYLKATLELLA